LFWGFIVSMLSVAGAIALPRLGVEGTDGWLTAEALRQAKHLAPLADIRLDHADVQRLGDEGTIVLHLRIKRAVDNPSRPWSPVTRLINNFPSCGPDWTSTGFRANPNHPLSLSGEQKLNLRFSFRTDRESIPYFPALPKLKRRSSVSPYTFPSVNEERLLLEDLTSLIARGEMDNAYHDYQRVRPEIVNPRDTVSNYKLADCRIAIAISQRDWKGAQVVLFELRDWAGSSKSGREAIRRNEKKVHEFYVSLTDEERKEIEGGHP
jgi:hypothetical protein